MGLIIEDGQGTGKTVGVTVENRLKVSSVTTPSEHEINHQEGQCYSVGVNVTPTAGAGTATCILYCKNNSDVDMVVSENSFTVDTTNVTVSMKLGDSGTPTNTVAGTAVNRNAGSGNTADATIYTGATGAGIGGVTGGSNVMTITVIAGNETKYIATLSGLIVPKNQVYTIWASGDCTNLRIGSGIHFHNVGH